MADYDDNQRIRNPGDYCCKCWLPYSHNPHRDAGKPHRVNAVGMQNECIPCLVLSRLRWSNRALEAEAKLRRSYTKYVVRYSHESLRSFFDGELREVYACSGGYKTVDWVDVSNATLYASEQAAQKWIDKKSDLLNVEIIPVTMCIGDM